jgi:phosphoenolpyruvate carboxykinase (diphosphate)
MTSLIDDPELLQRAVGWNREVANAPEERAKLRSYMAFQLASAGLPVPQSGDADPMASFSAGIFESLREKNRLLSSHRAPIDHRIEQFLGRYFGNEVGSDPLRLPDRSLVLDRHGMARELSLPADGVHYKSSLVSSYRCFNGVLNNPVADRRTTAGTFHVVEGGLPIADDKRAVPKSVFVKLFRAAMNPPHELMELPYLASSSSSGGSDQSRATWTSLLLRPLVAPAVEGYCQHKSLEVRFFAPGALVSNLDFVESIFGNAGDPLISANDAGLDVQHWSGHTGCVILATHLVQLTKKELGLPHYDDATDRQRRDSMCWRDANEKYNDGTAFKLTCRNRDGVVVTLIADNYYGYCKKEVKTQISYAANLMGNAEEEHAGGAFAFPSYSLGESFRVDSQRYNGRSYEDLVRDYSSFIDPQPEGYGIDRTDPTVIYIPENAFASLETRSISWQHDGKDQSIPLMPQNIYVAPSGYKIQLEKHPSAPSWRLIGTVGEGVFCHKPCTVSGGGKSEISKSLRDYMLYGPIFVGDREEDFKKLDEIFNRDYSDRWRADTDDKPDYQGRQSRSVLDPARSLGSTIQLLTPQPNFSDEYNQWLATIPDRVYALALIIKRFIKPEMAGNWKDYFGVDIVNGSPGHELKMDRRSLVGTYLRVGLDHDNWRTFKLRQDFIAAAKVQREDDISCSIVVPAEKSGNVGPWIKKATSYKFVENCEYRLFQRPDDAVHRGLDKQTEWDLSRPGNFISNFQPLTTGQAREIVQDAIEFDKFSGPMESMLETAASQKEGFVVSTAHPRVMDDGRVTSNPRYLQDRPDLVNHRDTYIARRGMQLHRALPADAPVPAPVGAVLSGRRNNPPEREAGIRSLAIYSPLHYQELPELVMDYVCSLTGKSPSTTGAGSEGALTKGPFNCLLPAIDLNALIVSMILTELGGFSTAAGHIGPNFNVGHDISLLIPEVWCRMTAEERDPNVMIAKKMLEKVPDFQHNGASIPASRLGYRITRKFVRTYLARVFDNPGKVLTDEILRPELQDLDSYADGVMQVVESQQKVAQKYFEDGGFEIACPPLRAVLAIMAQGHFEGKSLDHPEIRSLFTKESLLSSDWYRRRLQTKALHDQQHWQSFVERLEHSIKASENEVAVQLGLAERLRYAKERLAEASSPSYLDSLVGTIGLDPMVPSLTDPSMLNKLA